MLPLRNSSPEPKSEFKQHRPNMTPQLTSLSISPAFVSKHEALSKAEVEDGEIEDAKMTDAGSVRGVDDAKSATPRHMPTLTGTDTTSAAMDTSADGDRLQPPTLDQRGQRESSRSRQGPRAPDIPKRPDVERPPAINPRQQARLPRHTAADNRLPPRPDLMDNRRDRPDFNPRTRHGAPEHIRFDGPEVDNRGHGRMPDRDRDFPMRSPLDEPMRGPPYREGGRLPRDADWPGDRSGRPRHDSFHGRDGPPRGDLMADFPERQPDGPRRGEPPLRAEKDDRRPYPPRGPSPPRVDLPNRPERFPDDRRTASFNQTGLIPGEIPRGPRAGGHDPMGPDMTHGRLRQPDQPPDIPSGPRQRNRGRNVSMQQPAPSQSNGKAPTPERQIPSGPSRAGGRGGPEQPPATPAASGERLDTTGIHPDRLNNIVDSTPQAPSPVMTPQSGPRGGQGQQQGPRGPGGERGRGDKRFAGINNMLQQTNGPAERGNVTPPVRGRGATRQSTASNTGSPRPPTGPAAEDEGQPRNRPDGRGDLIDDASTPDNRRSGRGSDRDKNRDQNRDRGRRGGGGAGGAEDDTSSAGRREERRDRGRDPDRERTRRSDVGAGGSSREEKDRERAERRNPGSREEMRRRDRHNRDDGPPEMGGAAPPASGNANENNGRPGPSSSMGAPPPPPPPPPPPLPNDENSRRWGQGGNRPENRDRERERRDRGRERDGHHRESGGGSTHRKRGRPNNPEDNTGGDANARGQRMGGENKRIRRGQ